MKATRYYDFLGTELPIYLGFAGQVTDQILEEKQWVWPYGRGLALAQPLAVPLIDDGNHVADIVIGIANDHPACVSIVAMSNRGLTGEFLRSLPIASIVNEAAACNTYTVFKTSWGEIIGVYYSDAFENTSFGGEFETLRSEVGKRPRELNQAFFARVSSIYRDAIARGYPPARAVQELLGPTSPQNARRWIARARREGYLGHAPGRGKKGEIEAYDTSS